MSEVYFSHEGTDHPEDAMLADAEALLDTLGLSDAELSVVLCDDAFISPLNAQWRDKPTATDVLSFPQNEPGEPMDPVLGDIVISVQTATRQAADQGHPLEDELRVLLVHGLLHLLGHDHIDPDDARRMAVEEARLLASLSPDRRASLLEREGP